MRLDYSYFGRYVKIAPGSLASAFREFDPTDPHSIPFEDNKFGILLIALRARALLKHRDRDHIELIVDEIDAAVNHFFHIERDFWILENEDSCRIDDEWPPRFEDMDCPNPANTSINEALLECTAKFRDCGEFFTPSRLFELFAVMSLLHVDEALLRIRAASETPEWHARPALHATEAICNAEWIRCLERMHSEVQHLVSASDTQAAMIHELASERQRLRHEVECVRNSSVVEFRSIAGKSAVSSRWDQKLKPGWQEHCRMAIAAGLNRGQLEDLLNRAGYDPRITKIGRQSLRSWAREVGFTFIPGRRKQTDRDQST